MATTRFTSRVPSTGEKRTTISPRFGSPHFAISIVVNGTLRSYASLLTTTRSPSWIVGFIEPVGTSFQSARADRSELTTSSIRTKTLISSNSFFLVMPFEPTTQLIQRFQTGGVYRHERINNDEKVHHRSRSRCGDDDPGRIRPESGLRRSPSQRDGEVRREARPHRRAEAADQGHQAGRSRGQQGALRAVPRQAPGVSLPQAGQRSERRERQGGAEDARSAAPRRQEGDARQDLQHGAHRRA